jgi:hypothetical protein
MKEISLRSLLKNILLILLIRIQGSNKNNLKKDRRLKPALFVKGMTVQKVPESDAGVTNKLINKLL